MKRCFVSVDIPEEIRFKIKEIQDKLPEFYGKKTELGNLHLTLKFLGEIDDEKIKKIKKKLDEVDYFCFNAEFGGIGVFSENYVRIVWLELKNCEKLQQRIDSALESLFSKEKIFMSHLTIARIKKLKDKENFLRKLKSLEIPKIDFIVDNFKLKESILKPKGPEYRTLFEYKLKI